MPRKEENSRPASEFIDTGFHGRQIILIFTTVVSAALLSLVLHYSRYGIDFTDEGFYIVSIADPQLYRFNVPATLFGFVYHPLYQALSGDIGELRIVTNAATSLLSFVLAFQLLDLHWRKPGTTTGCLLLAAAGLSAASLLTVYRWLITPSYNMLALQGMLVTLVGLLALEYRSRQGDIAGILLIGLGGWLTFMAKASTAGALGLLIVAYGLLAGRRYWRPLLMAAVVASGFLIASALFIDGSIPAFIERLRVGVIAQTALGGGQGLRSLRSLYRVGLTAFDGITIAFFILAGGLAGLSFVSPHRLANRAVSLLGAIVIVAIIWLGCSGRYLWQANNAALFFGILGAVLATALAQRLHPFSNLARHEKLIALLLLGCPFVYALGTNNNYWAQAWPAGIFWVLAGVVLARPLATGSQSYLNLLPMILLVQLCTLNTIYYAFHAPYRQPPDLWKNHAAFLLRDKSRLILDATYRDYLTQAVHTAGGGGFRPGMPAIDLTGQSPGILFAIGAHSLGQPWLPGDYRGSDGLAITSLDQASCRDIARAWLLEEPAGPRSLSTNSVLRRSGAERGTDYALAGTLLTPENAGGYMEKRRQNLLRPTRSVEKAEMACLKARQKRAATDTFREKS